MAFSLVQGRYPTGVGEIALGATTLSETGAHIGSKDSRHNPQLHPCHPVISSRCRGHSRAPPEFGTGGFGQGAVVTVRTAEAVACPPGPNAALCVRALQAKLNGDVGWEMSIATAPGKAGRAAVVDLERRFRLRFDTARGTDRSHRNFGQAVNFPALLGITLAVFGAATLAHLLFVSVARRRREVAVLKVIGFVRNQVGAAVCWQSTTIGLVGIVLGVPIGVTLGRVIWRHLPQAWAWCPVDIAPVRIVVLLGIGVLVVGGLLAAIPAMLAARTAACRRVAGGLVPSHDLSRLRTSPGPLGLEAEQARCRQRSRIRTSPPGRPPRRRAVRRSRSSGDSKAVSTRRCSTRRREVRRPAWQGWTTDGLRPRITPESGGALISTSSPERSASTRRPAARAPPGSPGRLSARVLCSRARASRR